jgi:hypothetical protein
MMQNPLLHATVPVLLRFGVCYLICHRELIILEALKTPQQKEITIKRTTAAMRIMKTATWRLNPTFQRNQTKTCAQM